MNPKPPPTCTASTNPSSTPSNMSIRHQKPTPAWVIIGLFTSTLIVLLQCTLYFLSADLFAAFIVSLTYTSCIFLACAFSLTGHLLVRRYPRLDRFLNIDIDLHSVAARSGSLMHRMASSAWRPGDEEAVPPPPYVHHRHMDSQSSAGTLGSLANVHPALRPDVRRIQLHDAAQAEPTSPLVENAGCMAGTDPRHSDEGEEDSRIEIARSDSTRYAGTRYEHRGTPRGSRYTESHSRNESLHIPTPRGSRYGESGLSPTPRGSRYAVSRAESVRSPTPPMEYYNPDAPPRPRSKSVAGLGAY
ncbi:hypothetical protein EDC01DRAFT_635529 [Geopyxis carbonaria]|nr:hypothetical protein EDC01DRAFT_635529 [Geopyxis carbonaria]